MDEFLDSVEEAVLGHVNDRVFIMKLSALLQAQTFVALPNTLTVAGLRQLLPGVADLRARFVSALTARAPSRATTAT